MQYPNKPLKRHHWGPRVETRLVAPDQVADVLTTHQVRSTIEEVCYDIYVLVYDAAGLQLQRENVYHTHDADDFRMAFDFWRNEVEHSPKDVRALEAVKVVRTLQCMALKMDDEPPASDPDPTEKVFTSERNRG